MLTKRDVITLASFAGLWSILPARSALAQSATPMPVIASFSILGDLARQIGGARVAVTELIGPDQEIHGFSPSPADARKLTDAKVVLVNGLGLEGFMDRLIKASGSKARPVVLTEGVSLLAKAQKKDAHGHDHGSAGSDPHAWQSVANVKVYARNIAKAFAAADPAGQAGYDSNLAAYLTKLDELTAEIKTTLEKLPADRRTVVTAHNAFGYLARDTGLTFHALQGVSAESEPSAADMARIIRQLKALKAPAAFLENVTDPRKIQQITTESGARIGGTLYSDALSLANGPAPTYIDMMRHNMREITKALMP